MNVNWTNDLIFQLIDVYSERRLLWDHDIPDYKDKVKKHKKWQEIADIMNISKEIVMRKMKILTTQFQREYAKCRHRPSGEGSKWFAYTRLMFLAPNMVTRTSSSAGTSSTTVTSANTLNQYERYQVSPVLEECSTIEVKEEMDNMDNMDMSEGESVESVASSRRGRGGGRGRRKRPVPAVASHASPESHASTRDEYTVYGEYVALKLRNMADPYTRHKAQQHINDILFQAEMDDI